MQKLRILSVFLCSGAKLEGSILLIRIVAVVVV